MDHSDALGPGLFLRIAHLLRFADPNDRLHFSMTILRVNLIGRPSAWRPHPPIIGVNLPSWPGRESPGETEPSMEDDSNPQGAARGHLPKPILAPSYIEVTKRSNNP
jgi:hypothetical protein